MASAAIVPRVRMMALCDHIEASATEEEVFDLLGVRHYLQADYFPYVPPELWLYLVLSCARTGTFPGYVLVLDDATGKTVFLAKISPRFDEANKPLPADVAISCAFPHAGRYTIQVSFFQEDPGKTDIVKGETSFDVLG